MTTAFTLKKKTLVTEPFMQFPVYDYDAVKDLIAQAIGLAKAENLPVEVNVHKTNHPGSGDSVDVRFFATQSSNIEEVFEEYHELLSHYWASDY